MLIPRCCSSNASFSCLEPSPDWMDGKCTLKSEISRWNHGFVVFHPFKKKQTNPINSMAGYHSIFAGEETWCPPRELGQTKCYLRYTQLNVIVLLNVLILSFFKTYRHIIILYIYIEYIVYTLIYIYTHKCVLINTIYISYHWMHSV